MFTDSERFAFDTRRHHAFATTGNAYDASQCDEAISTGDTLVVLDEQVVAVAMTWPFAITAEAGKLHSVAPPREGETLADFEHAAKLARCLGFSLDPNLVPLLPA
jgi:hypothetical protein